MGSRRRRFLRSMNCKGYIRSGRVRKPQVLQEENTIVEGVTAFHVIHAKTLSVLVMATELTRACCCTHTNNSIQITKKYRGSPRTGTETERGKYRDLQLTG